MLGNDKCLYGITIDPRPRRRDVPNIQGRLLDRRFRGMNGVLES